jgi:cytochrome c oxidase assembly protein subunit 15
MSDRGYRRLIRLTFVSAYLVVLAGSVVRMTGSGMGCPDWPMCFGLAIPPTDVSEVTWAVGEAYSAGRMIVSNDTLWVATSDHVAGSANFAAERNASPALWTPYDKHDYAVFNPLHTWVEFINRLIGAFTGLPALMLLFVSVVRAVRGRGWRPVGLAFAVVVSLGFVAWLGKKVVDGNLIPGSITIHMLGAIVILLLLGAMLALSEVRSWGSPLDRAIGLATGFRSRLKWWGGALMLLALGQTLFGTQVREAIDALNHAGLSRGEWVENLPGWWKGHGFAAWAVLLFHLPAVWRLRSVWWGKVVGGAILGQFLTGLLMHKFQMPAAAQPIHLILALAVVIADGVLWLSAFRKP